jgi:hypothetical protein
VLEGAAPVLVAFNTGDRPEALDVDAAAAGLPDGSRLADRLGSGLAGAVEAGRLRLTLPPRTAAVLLP